jgi:hypothetical protein
MLAAYAEADDPARYAPEQRNTVESTDQERRTGDGLRAFFQ